MILSGDTIKKEIKTGHIEIDPFDESRINPNSYNLRLDNKIGVYDESILDIKKPNPFKVFKIPEAGLLLRPGNLYLCKTIERTYTDKYVPMIEGRSSIGRLGLYIHITAGFGDVGFNGAWTLELSTIHNLCIYPNIEVCQIYFHILEGKPILYKGKYNNNGLLQSSMMYKEFNNESNT